MKGEGRTRCCQRLKHSDPLTAKKHIAVHFRANLLPLILTLDFNNAHSREVQKSQY